MFIAIIIAVVVIAVAIVSSFTLGDHAFTWLACVVAIVTSITIGIGVLAQILERSNCNDYAGAMKYETKYTQINFFIGHCYANVDGSWINVENIYANKEVQK